MGWPRPVGVVFGGTAVHHACDERAEVERMERRAGNAGSTLPHASPTDRDAVRARHPIRQSVGPIGTAIATDDDGPILG
jgi:hypothetical protein